MPLYTCIIPCYNEFGRINKVIEPLLMSDGNFEIICIDDASIDGSAEYLKKLEDSRLKTIYNASNLGKYATLLRGIEEATTDIVVFIDADLVDFEISSLHNGINVFVKNDLDMLIFRRKNTLAWLELFGLDILLSGERIFRKKKFLELFLDKSIEGFEIELAMGKFSLDKGYKVGRMYSEWVNTFKFDKRGYIDGLIDDLKMYKDIGLFKNEWYKQYFAFKDSEYNI